MATETKDSTDAAMEPLDYFPHDADAMRDPKCLRLLRRSGMAGYGRWMRLCELMAAARGHHVPFATEEDVRLVADEIDCGSRGARTFVATLADVGLIDGESLREGSIYSERMGRNALEVGRRKAAGSSRRRAGP